MFIHFDHETHWNTKHSLALQNTKYHFNYNFTLSRLQNYIILLKFSISGTETIIRIFHVRWLYRKHHLRRNDAAVF